MIRKAVLLSSIGAIAVFADPPRPVVEPVPDVFTAAPFDQQRFGGLLESRMRANVEGYLEHIPVQQIAQALNGAQNTQDADLGKSAGLLLESAANSYEYNNDAHLKKVMDALAESLMSHQQSDGYIGAYPAAQRWTTPEDISSQSAILFALTDYQRVSGDDRGLEASRRLANSLVTHLSKGKGAVADAREAVAPLLELYRATNDTRYLAFCRRLSQSSLSELGKENSTYSFLSFLSGLVNLYQLTGDDAYAKAAVSGWRRIKNDQLTITGAPVSSQSSEMGCLTHAWLRLNIQLFQVEGEPQYAIEAERTIYNQLLASQDGETGKIDPSVPDAGSKTMSLNIQPCAAAISLGISEIPELMWGRLGSGVAILSYQPGHTNVRTRRRTLLQLYTESQYPNSGNILLHVEPNHDARFPLQLLVPEWTKAFRAEVGSTVLQGKPGQFLTLDREWKKGDTVKITIDMTAKSISSSNHKGEIAVQRGPQILCLVKGGGDLTSLSSATLSSAGLALKPVDGQDGSYSAPGAQDSHPLRLTLVPLADADGPYRVWINSAD